MKSQLIVASVAGQLLGLLGWIDPLYVVFILLGPPLVGCIAAMRGVPLPPVLVLWFSAGLNMLWVDWVVAREDVLDHAGLSVVMPALAALGWAPVAFVARRRAEA